MVFSWDMQKKRSVEIKIRRAKTLAKQGHSDMKLQHPDWVRDAQAQNPNYVVLTKKVKEEAEKKIKRNETFTRKLHQDG